jgi:FG-GAP repeat protein
MRRPARPSHRVGGSVAAAVLALLTARSAFALGSHYFANENLPLYKPQAGDQFGLALASGDFNGDGADDLATGIPGDDGLFGSERTDIGAVVVRYGRPKKGLDTGLATTVLNQIALGSDPPDVGDRFGGALASCDFNRDGLDDLAVGVPFEDTGPNGDDWADSGEVEVYYGAPGGISMVAGQFLTGENTGIPVFREPSDELGYALACGDLNGDGFADLAIGARNATEDILFFQFSIPAGTVVIVPGSEEGLDLALVTKLSENEVQGLKAESYDDLGSALAIGDWDGDGFADLAVGIPGADNDGTGLNGPTSGKGQVVLLFGGAGGFSSQLVLDESDFGGSREVG